MPKYKTALVTGGAGFIGSHVVDALIRQHIKVYVIDDLSRGLQKNVNPNAHFVKMSITSSQLPALLKRMKPDIIFHLAAQIDVQKAIKNPSEDALVNIVGTLKLANEAVEVGVKKFVFSSTGGAMYSDHGRPPYDESCPATPVSPYGIAKRSAEMYLAFLQEMSGMSSVVLRYANVYGPRQRSDGEAGVIAIFGGCLLSGKQAVINGDGKQTRDYVYVEDVVRANLLAMNKAVTGIFNIGTGKQASVNTLFRKLRKMAKSKMVERHAPACSGEILRTALQCKKAKKELGWSPRTTLDEGLVKTMKWLMKKS
ncbi:MAG: UDP-glucose 4-epimerase [Candidatus Uhrbacteria bacterium GW2011_GWE2_40_58]|nr:MAG: UDP-glucose 4-epimerase [Candidatus Uhrbacteria bacterium GW2011_GWF2_40_263]KKR67711.1 MAG: UDP-glucose 4-epimerase [Candidatus Uhrbacteria bacterium GW2011_GWE2_40_58]OGL94412.1 MAG: hypothetical protein A2239_01045 [Candidatus Uhrbacteria bacterium RIFOXYA2_FULL_40_9]OGL96639.1 MAG: hypothetical protein A2332_02715 [Candidatus Uhrbacteria bacterium RIFOXYB2_FULL_41_18]HBK34789.1 UDP-glucose 4-epimerase [Candidatus Uhrbacteria bacterium]